MAEPEPNIYPTKCADLGKISRDQHSLSIDFTTANLQLLSEFGEVRHLQFGAPKESDFRRIEELANLVQMEVFLRETESWPLLKLPKLRGLSIHADKHLISVDRISELAELDHLNLRRAQGLTDYSPIGHLTKLTSLSLGTLELEKQSIDSLNFLLLLPHLASLDLYFDTIPADVVDVLGSLSRLQKLGISNKISRDDFALLSRRLPRTECEWFAGYVPVGKCLQCGEPSLVAMAGKGERRRCRNCDSSKFEQMQAQFLALARITE